MPASFPHESSITGVPCDKFRSAGPALLVTPPRRNNLSLLMFCIQGASRVSCDVIVINTSYWSRPGVAWADWKILTCRALLSNIEQYIPRLYRLCVTMADDIERNIFGSDSEDDEQPGALQPDHDRQQEEPSPANGADAYRDVVNQVFGSDDDDDLEPGRAPSGAEEDKAMQDEDFRQVRTPAALCSFSRRLLTQIKSVISGSFSL